MKRNLNSIHLSLLAIGSLLFMTVLFSACNKSDDVNNNNPAAALMAFNLAPDKPAIGISIGANSLTNTPLNYTSYTGTYLNIFPGSREVASYDYGADSAFAKATENFEVNKYYSVFTLGTNGSYSNLIVKDELDTLSAAAGQAFVRYINAIPDSTNPLVTITANGTDLSNSSASFKTVSDFKGINPGEITVKVSNGTTISANRNITLEKDKVYTILLVGIPGNTDPAKLVEIKYITNGTVD